MAIPIQMRGTRPCLVRHSVQFDAAIEALGGTLTLNDLERRFGGRWLLRLDIVEDIGDGLPSAEADGEFRHREGG